MQKNLRAPLDGIRAGRARSSGSPPPTIRTALRTGDTTAGGARRDRPARRRTSSSRRPSRSTSCSRPSGRGRCSTGCARSSSTSSTPSCATSAGATSRSRSRGWTRSPTRRPAAHRPLGDRAPDRGGRAVPRRGRARPARSSTSATAATSTSRSSCPRPTCRRSRRTSSGTRSTTASRRWSRAHRTTLVFVNTRRMAERVAHHLGERLGEERVAAHHGSLAKERRLRIEQRLKAGEMRALVATASLELGIDVGSVDLVCQIGSPRAVTTFLQRIGRSGHALGRTSRGRLFATSRDELVECAALVRAVDSRAARPHRAAGGAARRARAADRRRVRGARVDRGRALRARAHGDTLRQARRATAFDEVVASLVRGRRAETRARGRAPPPRSGERRRSAGARAARIVALTNGGAIPDVADYRVVLDPDETLVGTVNEDWAIESMAGDVFVLGSHSWRIRRVESRSGMVRVEDAQGQAPTVPFWLGEAPARTWELSAEVSRLRAGRRGAPRRRAARRPSSWLAAECALGPAGAAQLARVRRGAAGRARRRADDATTSSSSASSTSRAACSSSCTPRSAPA